VGWFGKMTFGTMGLLFGGPIGAIIGVSLGHHLVDKKAEYGQRGAVPPKSEQAQAAYFVCIFSILGKIAKADGVVTDDELKVVDDFINGMKISETEKQFAKQVFNEAKNSNYSVEDFASQFYQINSGQPAVLQSFLDVLFRVAAADKVLHPAEEDALKKVKDIFQISDKQFNDIKSIYFTDVDRYYKLLSCSVDSSNDEIKKSYKKLVRDFHPDTIVSKGLPEEFTEFASSRFREIQEAYEKVRKERGF
jgi:DnaJ like chaperone protein